jgi:hypothetical protein
LPNTPPQISDVANQTVALSGSTGPLTFTVFDAETAASGLTVTATSSNPDFVAASGIAITGTGQDRTVTVIPTVGLTGSSTITLTATDAGGLTATDTFSVSVLPAVPPVTLGSTDPRILLTPTELDDMRQKAAANTPQWQAFKARLDANLTQLVMGYYQGFGLTWIADYALGYRVLEQSDPATAAKYADKAIAVMKSGLRDYQKGGWETRQFLTRGDGSTTTFTLPNSDVLPATVHIYLSNVTTKAVTRGSQSSTDAVDYYTKFLKASNTPDGPADYTEGLNWQHTGDQYQNQITWLLGGSAPTTGATYYVTETSVYAASRVAFALNGNTITLNVAPTSSQAVFVEYVYGTHAADGSTLAYQQTSAGDGGFNSIYIDTTYTSRNLGKYIAMGYDWLNDYTGFTQTLRSEAANLLVRWSDYIRDNGYYANSPASNYGAGGYVSRMFTALALSGGRDPNGDRLVSEMAAYRQNNLVPVLQNPTTSLVGGFWSEGWNYGNLATRNVILAGLAYESAGLGSATAERTWASEVVTALVSSQPTRDTVYDGGDGYAYPAPFPSKDLFYILAAASTDPVAQKYANYVIQNYSSANTRDFQDLIYRDPSATAAFWSDLPLQYRAAGTGLVTARADWSYNSTWVSFQLGNLLKADHQTYTPGQVQLQRGADALLVNANAIGGAQSLTTKSSFGNLIAIDDNGDGVQTYRWSTGVWYGSPGVVTTAYEATNAYMYVAGDYHAAYSRNTAPGLGGPASELIRQVVYLRPDFVLVHDRATTIKDAYPKQLQWHFLNAPSVSGNSWVEAVGSSKLFGQTFSSQPITTTAQPVTDGTATVYRVATNNAAPSQKVRYITALQTAPSTTASMVATQQVTSTDGRMEGVQMANQVVLFGTDGAVSPASGITYNATGSASLSHLLTDLQPGRAYQVTVNGSPVGTLAASNQGTLSFTTTTTGALTIQIA